MELNKQLVTPSCTLSEHEARSFYTVIRSYCIYLLRSEPERQDLVEDLVQDVMLKVVKKRSSFNGRSSINTWIYKICQNTFKDYLRWKKRKESKIVIIEPDSIDSQYRFIDPILRSHFLSKLNHLSVSEREMLRLAWVEGYSNEEIAKMKHMTSRKVRHQLSSIRKKISKK